MKPTKNPYMEEESRVRSPSLENKGRSRVRSRDSSKKNKEGEESPIKKGIELIGKSVSK